MTARRGATAFDTGQPLLSRTADYALRALLVLARHGVGRWLPADTIADLSGMPRNYTAKTLNALGRAGLVRSMRGPSGGFGLDADPAAVSVADVAGVFAERVPLRTCLLGARPCDRRRPCAAHARWTGMAAASRAPLRATTLADLLAGTEWGAPER